MKVLSGLTSTINSLTSVVISLLALIFTWSLYTDYCFRNQGYFENSKWKNPNQYTAGENECETLGPFAL